MGPPVRRLGAVLVAASLPFLLVELVPALHGVMDVASYLVFHNVAEFFSIMVSLSVFGAGWYAYDQSRDRHALFLGTAFLATGLIDFMHAMANAAMPAFVTPNSANKSTQFWIAARLLNAGALLASARVQRETPRRWAGKSPLLLAALGASAVVFVGVTFFPARLPETFVPGMGLTAFKVGCEYAVIALLLLALWAYWRRLRATGDQLLVLYMAAFVILAFGEAAFASYTSSFDTFNVLGHAYKVAAFLLIYDAAFAASVRKPYAQLATTNERLRSEVAERHRAEDQVRTLNAELEQRVSERTARLEAANAELRRAEEALREASRRKDEFLGMLSHELRNPLAPIRNSVYLLERADPATGQAARARAVIQRQTEHLTRLVDDLLDVTRVARGKIELRRGRTDLREIVRRVADDRHPILTERGVTLRAELPDAEVWSEVDATRIAQLLGNLLHNAEKFTRSGDRVELTLRAGGGEAEIRVRDTGAGIDAALLPHVFDSFVQGDSTLSRGEGGLGLGLALVKGIAELHGGRVRAASAGRGHGAEFVVTLPADGVPPTPGAQASPAARHAPPRRVLVVDDNVDAAESLAEVLKVLGHAVEIAHDGRSALERARANPPDVVLCDVGLPGMTGYEVAKALRAGAATMRVFAVSGYAQAADVKTALEAGFDGHLAKPCDPAHLARLLG
jgi:signal transduction histidine kinase/CheY-like chemotaxis protein